MGLAGGQNINNSTTRQICAGSLALADYLYRRKVTRQFNILPKDDLGVTAGLSALPDVHQWWYECLLHGNVIGSLNSTPWADNMTPTGKKPKWIELREPFVIQTQEMYEAFRNWWRTNNMGTTSDTTTQRQFVIQMNEALRSRTGIVGPKRPRTDRDS